MSNFPQKFGRYELVGRISNGGMAEVYLARIASTSGNASATKVFAIKKILPDLSVDQSFVKLFEREIGLAMALSHPNIVRIFDFGTEAGEYFMAMEYVHGKPLQIIGAELTKDGNPPPWELAAYSISQTCKALAYAHGYQDPVTKKHAGIIHRDISPHNILMAYSGQVKLFDFGVGKVGSRDSGTEAGVVKGKPAYLAPEQVRCEDVDSQADIFALGIVFWEQLTGRRLFFDNQPLLAIRKVTELEIPLPSSINPKVPKSIDAIAMKALERDKKKRYLLAKDFGTDIERAVFNENVVYGEKQAREHLAKIFGDAITLENQSLISKVSGQAFSEPTLTMNMPGAGSSAGVSVKSGGTPASGTSMPAARIVQGERTMSIDMRVAQTQAPPQPMAQQVPSSSIFSFANIALALLLVGGGGWGAMKMRGEPQTAVSEAPSTQTQGQAPSVPQRTPAQILDRKEMERLLLAQGPLDEMDVQVISAFRSGFAKRSNVLPQVVVRVTKSGGRPIALVLASYEAIDWRLSIERGVRLERILLSERADEISATQVNVSGEGTNVNVEYVNLGYLPLDAESRKEMLEHKVDATNASVVKLGSPEDVVHSLATEICFQGSISQTQFISGRCQKFGGH